MVDSEREASAKPEWQAALKASCHPDRSPAG